MTHIVTLLLRLVKLIFYFYLFRSFWHNFRRTFSV